MNVLGFIHETKIFQSKYTLLEKWPFPNVSIRRTCKRDQHIRLVCYSVVKKGDSPRSFKVAAVKYLPLPRWVQGYLSKCILNSLKLITLLNTHTHFESDI